MLASQFMKQKEEDKFYGLQKIFDEKELEKLFGTPFQNKKQIDDQQKQITIKEIKQKNINIIKKFIFVNPESGLKSIWDVFILIIVFYSCYTAFFWASYQQNEYISYDYFDIFVECCFVVDLLINFVTIYIDEITYEPIYSFRKCAIRYLKGTFIFDLIAIFPFNLIYNNKGPTKLTRTIRVVRFMKVLDINSVSIIINQAVININPKSKIAMQYIIRYFYVIFRFMVIGFSFTYFLSCIWYIVIIYTQNTSEPNNFIDSYELNEQDQITKAITCFYFTICTLATVGYGDLVPKNQYEQIFVIFIMIVGIAFFSYLMNNFQNIIQNFSSKLGYIDNIPDLEEWLLSLNKDTESSMNKKLVNKIYNHFTYFYQNHRLLSIEKDDRYFNLMQDEEKKKLIRHLFQDIFSGMFRTLFLQKGKDEYHDYNFYIDMAFSLLPRRYLKKEVILYQGQAVNEVYLLMQGEIEVSFMVDGSKIKRYFSSGFFFGLIEILTNKLSRFQYTATTQITMFIIDKNSILEIINKYSGMKQDFISNAFHSFKYTKHAMIEEFIQIMKEKSNVDIKEEEANKIFNRIMRNIYKNQQEQSKYNIDLLTAPYKVNANQNIWNEFKETKEKKTSNLQLLSQQVDDLLQQLKNIND